MKKHWQVFLLSAIFCVAADIAPAQDPPSDGNSAATAADDAPANPFESILDFFERHGSKSNVPGASADDLANGGGDGGNGGSGGGSGGGGGGGDSGGDSGGGGGGGHGG